jgi:hypothetical protein
VIASPSTLTPSNFILPFVPVDTNFQILCSLPIVRHKVMWHMILTPTALSNRDCESRVSLVVPPEKNSKKRTKPWTQTELIQANSVIILLLSLSRSCFFDLYLDPVLSVELDLSQPTNTGKSVRTLSLTRRRDSGIRILDAIVISGRGTQMVTYFPHCIAVSL